VVVEGWCDGRLARLVCAYPAAPRGVVAPIRIPPAWLDCACWLVCVRAVLVGLDELCCRGRSGRRRFPPSFRVGLFLVISPVLVVCGRG
jgi:hypothetical protein